MKKIFGLMGVALLFAGSVHAGSGKLYLIDMTGSKFKSDHFNMMDDGIVGDFAGFGIVLSGQLNKDFSVRTKGSARGVRARAEHLGSGAELDVNFQPDHHFPIRSCHLDISISSRGKTSPENRSIVALRPRRA